MTTDEPTDSVADTPLSRFGSADLHAHTSYGDGMVDVKELFDRIEALTDLDVVAITDHDDVRGSLLAREVHARGNYRFELITGTEVTTRSGHLLALWVDEPVPHLRPLGETVATIHRLGGLAVIAHPLSYLTRSVGERALDRVLADPDPEARPDGLEVANPSPAGRVTGAKALRLNRERFHLAETGGSDAHFPEEIGTGVTLFPGRTADDVRAAILAHTTSGARRAHVPLRTIGLRRLAQQQVRGLAVTPTKVLGPHLRRLTGRRER